MILPAWTASAAEPPPAAWFEYELTEAVSGASGEYRGYLDSTHASGRYELAPDASGVRVVARYDWSYSGPEKSDHGRVDRTTSFDPTTRRYTGDTIDLDDPAYASTSPSELETWLWVDPATAVGATVRVLGEDCVLQGADEPVPSSALRGLRVRCSGEGERHDDYGDMTYTYSEDYWYDRATGYVLAEQYSERDHGTIEGAPGSFVRKSELRLSASSYVSGGLPAAASPAPSEAQQDAREPGEDRGWLDVLVGAAGLGLMSLLLGGGVVGTLWVIRAATRVPDVVRDTSFGTVRVAPLADALALAGRDTSACTKHFAPFLEDFAERARAAGDPVWTATAEDGRVVGLAWWDREAEIGTVLCPDAKVTANLVRRLKGGRAVEFFSEHRHMTAGKPTYNLHERWVVLARRADEEFAVDAATVRRYQPADRADAIALLQKEWGAGTAAPTGAGAPTGTGGPSFAAWLDRQVERGDPAFVAVVGGKVVGFALASVVGANGRLALAVVDPGHRDRGLGTELVRARLTALHRLGVERVIVEVADWNVAPLHVLRKTGFEDAGELFVESSATTRRRRSVVRR